MRRRRRYLWPMLAAVAVIVAAGPVCAATYQVEVEAQPPRLAAGAAEPCAITARITDSAGSPVPDGTEVTFVTTLGTIEPQTAQTAAGMARAELKSDAPGTAEVSVLVAGERRVVVVEFVAGAGAGRAPVKVAPMIRISGRYLAYSADYDCITASDGARAEHGELRIEAGNIQYEVGRGLLKAQHEVRISSGGAALEGDRACYFVASGCGALLRARDEVERIAFRADDLAAAADPLTTPANFLPTDTSGTNTWVVAREAVVFPRERIQFSDASLYVGERRILSLPHYVAPLRGQRGLLNQIFSVSSNGGLNLDVPFYYAASEGRVGSLHLRRRSAGSYGYGRSGWSLGIEEQYRLGGRSEGRLALDDVTENTRSLRLDHRIDFSSGRRLDFGLNYYRYNPSYPGALTGRALYYDRLRAADLTVIALGSSVGGAANWSVDANLRRGSQPLGNTGVAYDVTANLGYGGGGYGYGGGLCLGGGIGLAPPDWRIGRSTALSLDLVHQYLWAQVGGTRTTFDARALLRQALGGMGSLSVAYNYNVSRGGYYSAYGREQLSVNAYLSQGVAWHASGYLSYGLDRDSVFASGSVSYRLPIGGDPARSPWRLDLRGSLSEFGGARVASSRIALGRAVGNYEVLACYSPGASYGYGAYGYGYGRGKTFWLELAPLGY